MTIRDAYHGPVIAVGGPPHSGKSVFLAELYTHLKRFNTGVFLQRACPDGEGMWSAEAGYDLAQSLRRTGQHSLEWNEKTANCIVTLGRNVHLPMVLVDLGGKRLPDNELFLARTTHALVVSHDPCESREWKVFIASQGSQVIGEINTTMKYLSDDAATIRRLDPDASAEVCFQGHTFVANLANLDRDSTLSSSTRGAISGIAGWLYAKFRS